MVPLLQVAVMAAVVATLAYLPASVALALILTLLGLSPESVATFGGGLNLFVGLALWWLIAFALGCAYAAWMLPWREKVLAWPKRR